MGNTTHGKKKMPGLSSSTKLTVPPAEVKKNGGKVKDYRDWGANWLSSKFVIQYFIPESESGRGNT
jgi:hypothetical protein